MLIKRKKKQEDNKRREEGTKEAKRWNQWSRKHGVSNPPGPIECIWEVQGFKNLLHSLHLGEIKNQGKNKIVFFSDQDSLGADPKFCLEVKQTVSEKTCFKENNK